jgi:hypothetical protein
VQVLKDEVSLMFAGLGELRGGVGSALRGYVHTLGMDTLGTNTLHIYTQGTIPRVPRSACGGAALGLVSVWWGLVGLSGTGGPQKCCFSWGVGWYGELLFQAS